MSLIVDAALSMYLDLYKQIDEQDPDTGAIKKQWIFYKTVPCYAKGIISNTTTARSGDRQVFNNKYENVQLIEIRTKDRLTSREKITNIRDARNTPIWIEIDYPSDTPTVFEVVGGTPMTDPFGTVLAYNTVAKRSENQQIGI
jgi:hypothetical protein